MSKKKKPQMGYAEFNMHHFARDLVLGHRLSPSSMEIKKEIEKRNYDDVTTKK
jgi:hypothetical protein